MSDSIKMINTEKEFQDLIAGSDKPVLVDFWATWCGPCRMMNPILSKIADEQKDVVIAKVDVDALQGIAQQYNITSIPTILTFKNGQKLPEQVVGAVPPAVLNAHIQKIK